MTSSAKKLVLKKYKSAYALQPYGPSGWFYIFCKVSSFAIGYGTTELNAWKDAANKLTKGKYEN
jgi:hypothetical protein